MATKHLAETILDGGVRAVNFFNGRLLTGEDLTQERAANRIVSARLGQAVGAGVAFGLEVSVAVNSAAAPVLAIKPGLAVNAAGATLALSAETTVALVRPNDSAPATAGAFGVCPFTPTSAGAGVIGRGVYLLLLRPASAGVGRAPVNALNDGAAKCNTRDLVEGVQFRSVPLPFTLTELNATARLRNLVASRCFGVEDPQRTAVIRNPFGSPAPGYGALDQLRADRTLTDCDVPLAAFCWTAAAGITFIDLWAVRRRLTQAAVTNRWNPLVGDRRRSEAEAMFTQFQEQVETMIATDPHPESVSAADCFSYLPPVGILPLAGAGVRGFNYETFFRSRPHREPAYMEGDRLEPLVRTAMSYGPILRDDNEMVWLYLVRENRQAPPAQPYVVFTSGHVPFQGNPLFDVAHADFSHYPPKPYLTELA